MPNANYQRGRRLENLARAQLERQGYNVVRSAGSKGAIDLVAWNESEILLIQVKAAGAMKKADLVKMRKVKVPPHGRRLMFERDGGFSEWITKEV